MTDGHGARIIELERRVLSHDEKIDRLTEKVAEFVGEAKGVNKLLAIIVGLSAIVQVGLQILLRFR